MKLRYTGYVILAAALALFWSSCGKKEEQPAETASTASQPAGHSGRYVRTLARLAARSNWMAAAAPHKINMAAEAYCRVATSDADERSRSCHVRLAATLANVVVLSLTI